MRLLVVPLLTLVHSSLQAYYQFWSDSGQAVLDRSGNGHHGISGDEIDPDPHDASLVNRGAYFPPYTRAIIPLNAATGQGIIVGASFSFTAWVIPYGFCAIYRRYLVLGSAVVYWQIRYDSAVPPKFYMGMDLLPDSLFGQSQVALGQWGFFSVKVDCTIGCQIIGFKNASIVMTQFAASYADNVNFLSAIGGRACFIYELKIYNHSLTPAEVTAELLAPGTGGCPGSCSSPCITRPKVFCPAPCEFIPSPEASCTASCPCSTSLCLGDCRMCQSSCSLPTCSGIVFFDCKCHSSCDVCSGPSSNQCITCIDANALVAGGECVCKVGFYPSTTEPFICSLCHPTCFTCVGHTASECSSCKSQAVLAASGACECAHGTFPDSDSSNCLVCDGSCEECIAAGPSGCSKCKPSGLLLGPPPNYCLCNDGFYQESLDCFPCRSACATCSSLEQCTACKSNAQLVGFDCQCAPGFYGDPTDCISCSKNCAMCAKTGCVQCKHGLIEFGQDCVFECPSGFVIDAVATACTPGDSTPPVPTLSVTAQNGLKITFDKPMQLALTASDVSITAADANSRVIPVTWNDPVNADSQTIDIVLTFETSWLPARCTVALTFLFPEKVTDTNGVQIGTATLTGDLTAFGDEPQAYSVLLQGETAAQTTAAAQATIMIAGVSSILGGSASNLFSIINQLQLISYLAMTKLPVTAEFGQTLAALNIGLMVPNPIGRYVTLEQKSQIAPDYIQHYGISSTLFLRNAFAFLSAIGLMLANVIPIYLLSKTKNVRISNYFGSLLSAYRWSIPASLWLTSYLDLGVFALLQVQNPSAETLLIGGSVLSAGFVAFFFTVTPLFVVVFIYRTRSAIVTQSDSEFNSRWGSLFADFDPRPHPGLLAFHPLFLLRRATLAVTLIWTADCLKLFGVVNSAISVCSFVYLTAYRPLKRKAALAVASVLEGATVVTYVAAASFAFDLSASIHQSFGSIGTWAVRFAIAVNVVSTAVGTVWGAGKYVWSRMKLVKIVSQQRVMVKRSAKEYASFAFRMQYA